MARPARCGRWLTPTAHVTALVFFDDRQSQQRALTHPLRVFGLAISVRLAHAAACAALLSRAPSQTTMMPDGTITLTHASAQPDPSAEEELDEEEAEGEGSTEAGDGQEAGAPRRKKGVGARGAKGKPIQMTHMCFPDLPERKRTLFVGDLPRRWSRAQLVSTLQDVLNEALGLAVLDPLAQAGGPSAAEAGGSGRGGEEELLEELQAVSGGTDDLLLADACGDLHMAQRKAAADPRAAPVPGFFFLRFETHRLAYVALKVLSSCKLEGSSPVVGWALQNMDETRAE